MINAVRNITIHKSSHKNEPFQDFNKMQCTVNPQTQNLLLHCSEYFNNCTRITRTNYDTQLQIYNFLT
jgi:hypothetical protein